MNIIVGTAGHIDHGKTALVKALTGVNTDRLPEEKKRGITIDLGFAELNLDGRKFGFIDVPGHEKFVKNMLAGASGIDLVILVVAADEGVMPQTREHFEICRLLETKRGLVVLTKKDLVDEEDIELANLDVAELVEDSFLENAPVVSVSSKTGVGFDELKKLLTELAEKIPTRKNEIVTRLPIDRTFTVKGFGAVVTGTLATGEITGGSEMEILPIGRHVRVRGIQTHGRDSQKAVAGQRTAVNLGGIDHTEVKRGMVLSEPNSLSSTQIFDADVEVIRDSARTLKSRQRVRIHIGTLEVLARIEVLNETREIIQGDKDLVQIRLEGPAVAIPGERFILRHYSPQITIAGGRILNSRAKKHRAGELDQVRANLLDLAKVIGERDKISHLKILLDAAGESGLTFSDLQKQTGWRGDILRRLIDENVGGKLVIKAEPYYLGKTPFENLAKKVTHEVENHHKSEPLSTGILRETLRERTASHISVEIFRAALEYLEDANRIAAEKDIVRSTAHSQDLSPEEKHIRQELQKIYTDADLHVPTLDKALVKSVKDTGLPTEHARKVFQLLLNKGVILKINEEFYFAREAVEDLVRKVKDFAEHEVEDRLITVPIFKEIAGVSRKYAIPLLEYLDSEKITKRAGDKRLVL